MSGDDDLERRVLALIEQSLQAPSAERRDFIIAQSAHDAALRRRALQILAKSGGARAFLPTGGALADSDESAPPERIGAYRIEREIGRGGMGAVYFGRRISDDFDHVAAVKVVRADLASPRFVERLRAERRTLARLKHPNIAQMYDGGETEEGAPYFIMEFVDGVPLHAFIDEENPTLAARLALFLDICDAVAYAHHNLIIHRDLTPANILVTQDGRAKLIDFGIAHSLEEGGLPAHPQMTMTKGYGAPERLAGAPASTISDIYSLGVILGDMAQEIAASRRRDLDAVIEKARAADPADRYQTADALIADIRAYQRGDPVAARGDAWSYRLARFIGRRKVAAVAAALSLAAIAATSVVSTLYYFRARAAEANAQERFNEVRELANYMMFDLHDDIAQLDGSTETRQRLVSRTLGYLDELSAAPLASRELAVEIARGYKRLADVTGNPGAMNLGRRDQTAGLLQKAAAQISQVRDQHPDDADIARAYVEIFEAQALLASLSEGDQERANELFDEAAAAAAQLVSLNDGLTDDLVAAARIYLEKGHNFVSMGRYDDAVAEIAAGVDALERLFKLHPGDRSIRYHRALAYVYFGEATAWRAYGAKQPYDAALPLFEKGIAELRAMSAGASFDEKMQLVTSLLKRSNTTCYMPDRGGEGLADLLEADALSAALLEVDPNNDFIIERRGHIAIQKMDCLYRSGRGDEAFEVAGGIIDMREAQLSHQPDNPGYLINLLNTLSVIAPYHVEAEDWASACALAQRGLGVVRDLETAGYSPAAFQANEIRFHRDLAAQCAERGLR